MSGNQKSKKHYPFFSYLKKDIKRLFCSLFIYSRIEDIKEQHPKEYSEAVTNELKNLAKKLGIPTAKYNGAGIHSDWAKLEEDIKIYSDRIQGTFWALFALVLAIASLFVSIIILSLPCCRQ